MIAKIAALVTIVAVPVGGYVFVDDRYARHTQLADTAQSIQAESLQFRIKDKVGELNSIMRRVNAGETLPGDLDRKFELEQELQLLRDRSLNFQKNSDKSG